MTHATGARLKHPRVQLTYILFCTLLTPIPSPAQHQSDALPLESLKNIIHYRSGPTCFKDLSSHFGVFWTDEIHSFEKSHSSVDTSELEFLTHGWGARLESRKIESLGVGPEFVTALYGNDSIVFTPALQGLRVAVLDGTPATPSGSVQRDFYPFGVIETQPYPHGITVSATTVFADLNTLLIKSAVKNNDLQRHTVLLELVGTTNADALNKRVKYDVESGWLVRYHTPFTVWIEENLEWNSPWVYLGPPDRQVDIYWNIRSNPRPKNALIRSGSKTVRSEADWELARGTSGALGYVQDYGFREIAPHSSFEILTTVCFSFERPDSAVYRAGNALLDGGTDQGIKVIEAAKSRWERVFQNLPPLPSRYERYRKLYQHAAMTLVMDEYQGRGRWLGNRTSSYVARSVLPAMGFWDTCFTSVGMREVDPQKAEDFIHVLIDHPIPTSLVPSILSEDVRTGDGQAPILAWAAWRIYERTGDRDFLKGVYPTCARLNRFWFDTQDRNHNGLPEWRNGGQIGDNSPRWDKNGQVRTNLNMGEFESPDLAGFLLMDLQCLALMARTLGNSEEGRMWDQKAADLSANLVSRMYFASDNAFWDVDIKTGKPWSRAVTPNMFIPLWAGASLPKPQIDAMIHAHMLNPAEMNGAVPFPSVAYNDKTYDPLAYWRGIMWPHFVYWMVETLQKNGHPDEANRVADRLLEFLSSSEYLHECYESTAGKPAGIPEYNWTAAATIELLLERWKTPL